jgi:hypothetical protein
VDVDYDENWRFEYGNKVNQLELRLLVKSKMKS